VRHAPYEASTNRIWNVHEHYRDSASGLLQRRDCHTSYAKNHVRWERNQFRRVSAIVGEVAPAQKIIDYPITTDRPSQLLESLGEQPGSRLRLCIVWVEP